MKRFDQSFEKLFNKPCWGVKRGIGSFMTFEFGEPHLQIKECIISNKLRRLAHVRGDWHFWLYCCDWRVLDESNKVVGDCSSKKGIDRAARFLNGQSIIAAKLVPRGMRTYFEFDLGGYLETNPYNRTFEQWSLYEPNGKVLTVRADKHYSYQSGNTPPEKTKWLQIE